MGSIRPQKHSVFYPTADRVAKVVAAILVVYAVYLFSYFLMHKTDLFQLDKVEISGNQYLEDDAIVRAAKIDTNQTLFQVNQAEVRKALLANEYISGVSVSRVLPSTLIIDVQERAPVLYLVDKSLYMVDATGDMLEILPRMPVGKLPILTGLSRRELLEDPAPLHQAIALTQKIREVDESLFSFISEIHLSKSAYPELYLVKGGAKVRLGPDSHYQRLYLLSEFLSKKPIVNKLADIKRIDLTFENRIIVQNKS